MPFPFLSKCQEVLFWNDSVDSIVNECPAFSLLCSIFSKELWSFKNYYMLVDPSFIYRIIKSIIKEYYQSINEALILCFCTSWNGLLSCIVLVFPDPQIYYGCLLKDMVPGLDLNTTLRYTITIPSSKMMNLSML